MVPSRAVPLHITGPPLSPWQVSAVVVDVQMPVEGSDVQDTEHVDWFIIDTDAYCNVLDLEPPVAPDTGH